MIRAQVDDTPAMRKRPKKLSSESLPDLETISCSLQSAFGRNHLSVILFSSFSVTCKSAFETSGSRGDPFGNACRSNLLRLDIYIHTYVLY
ncbi:hypothetical protein HanIR_Chr15g0786361 [Helianthus annuus]|nr:hypothetical protein HanIR_Chr15g0786361 [Helianthus annuus]